MGTAEPEPRVGIFWLLRDRVVHDTSLLSDAEPYGKCLGHPESHYDYWTRQQRLGAVPRDMEYEESPRGRIVYDTITERFTLFADRCVLAKKSFVNQVLSTMHLPTNRTDLKTDGHYRCYRCLEAHEDA